MLVTQPKQNMQIIIHNTMSVLACIITPSLSIGDLCVFRHVTAIIQAQKSNLKPKKKSKMIFDSENIIT